LAGAAACFRPAADNLLFVSFDTTRADRLSAYGYSRITSPAVDSLAERGVLFTRAYSHVPSTLPAHSTMFTGLLPPQHGVRCNGKFRLPESRTTLAEILAAPADTGAAGIPIARD
jgi:arylsulfatase A-like enzyme